MGTRLNFATATAIAALMASVAPSQASVVLATATINNPNIAMGNFHRGAAVTAKGISVTNTVTGSPQQKLDGNVIATTGGVVITTGGFFTLLAPGATNNVAIKAAIDTSSVGSKNGTIKLKFVSDGTGTNGINTNLPSQTVNVTGAVYDYANPTIGNPLIALGNYHVGDVVGPQGVSITNTVISNAAYQEGLDAVANGSTGGVIAQGSVSLIAAGHTNNTGVTVAIDTSTAGDKSGTASILLHSDGTGTSNLGNSSLPSQTVDVTGAAYDYAQATIASPLNFGNHHVGDVVAMQGVSVTNSVVTNAAYQEGLNASIAGTTGGITTNGGSFNLLAAGSTDSTSIQAGIDTSSAGDKSGTLTLGLVSDGTGTSGLGTTALPSQSVNVNGAVYNYASSSTLSAVNFGIHHVGDPTVTQAVSVTNTAPAGPYSEGLDSSTGSFSGTGGSMLGSSGSISNLAAGSTDSSSIALSLNTGSAGVLNGTMVVHQASNGATTSGLGITALADQTVAVTGQVNAYAHGAYVQTGGGGTLTGSGASYLIDFGSVHQNTPSIAVQLGVMNDVTAPADALSGHFTLPALPSELVLAGFTDFSNLAPGASDSGLSAMIDTSHMGFFDVFVTLDLFGSNASGYFAALPTDPTITLEIKGRVTAPIHVPGVPEPLSMSLFGAGLIGAGYLRTRRKQKKT